MLSENTKKLLNKYKWNIYYFNSETDFTLQHFEGSKIKNSKDSLNFLIEKLEEMEIEESEENSKRLTDEEIFEYFGYDVLCISPLEVEKGIEFISGFAAKILAEKLRSKKFVKELFNKE